jgi:hypothetical protein
VTLIEALARYVERSLSRHPMRGRVRIAVSSDEYRAIEVDMRARGYSFVDGVVSGVKLAVEDGRRNEDLVQEARSPADHLVVATEVAKSEPVALVGMFRVDSGMPAHTVRIEGAAGSSVTLTNLEVPPEEAQAALEEAVEDLKENAEDLFEAPAPQPEPRAPMNHRGGRRRG